MAWTNGEEPAAETVQAHLEEAEASRQGLAGSKLQTALFVVTAMVVASFPTDSLP